MRDLIHALSDAERHGIRKAVESRRHEYATGRWLAHQALVELGVGVRSIPTGPNREPVWPATVKGSITHADGHAAVALTVDPAVAGVGIDLEKAGRVGESLLPRIFTDRERARLDDVDPTLVFSAKESCFKLLFPIFREFVEFHAVEITLDAPNCSFTMSYLGDCPNHAVIEKAVGSYRQIEGCWLTCVSLVSSAE